MEKVKINANRKYLVFLMIMLTAACGVAVWFAISIPELAVLSIIAAAVLITADVTAFAVAVSYIELEKDAVTVRVIKLIRFAPGEVNSIEWQFFSGKNGSCYINLKSGRIILLPRTIFASDLKEKLSEYAKAHGISQRGGEEEAETGRF